MATFGPASNIWTLNYDPFGGICWQNRATQELYFIPPGPPPALPPRSLANCVRQNYVNSLPVTPPSEVHPPQGFGGPVHFNNNNPALRVPEAAREGPVSFVGCPQPNPSPSILTEDGNRCLPAWGLPNALRRYYPNDPCPTPAVTARTHAPPLQQPQARGTGVNFNTNSALEEPKDAKLRPVSLVDSMGSYPRLPMSGTKNATHGLPPTSAVNKPLSSLPSEPHRTTTADDHTKASLLLRGEEGGQLDPSALKRTETARLRPKAIAEEKKPHPSLPVARVEDSKHGSSANSLLNAPRSNISNDTTLIRGNCGREQFDNDSVLRVPEPRRLRPESIAEEKKPHPCLPMERVGNEKHRLSAKSLSNAPRSNNLTDLPFTSAATRGDKASLVRGTGEREQFGNKSGMGIPGAMRLQTAPITEDKAPYPSTPMSRTDDVMYQLPRTMLVDISSTNNPPESHLTTSAERRSKASLRREGGEGGQFDPSGLKVSETARPLPDTSAEDKKYHPSLPMLGAGEAKHGFSTKGLSDAPCSNISNYPPFMPDTTVGAVTSLTRGDGEREQFGNNSTLKVPMGVEVRPESISQNTKSFPSHLASTADDTKHGFSLKMSSNAPRSNIIKDPPLNESARPEASLFWGGDEGGQFDNNSSLEIPVASLEWVACINPRSSASMSRAKEAKQWSRTRDNQGKEYYFNITTGESQSKKPDCLKKYTYRR